MLIKKLPADLLQSVILAYNAKMAGLKVKPLPVEFLTGEKGDEALKALASALAKKNLERRLKAYEDKFCKPNEIPAIDAVVFDLVDEKVSVAYEGYKASIVEKGAEYVFGQSYYISIANEIRFFFAEFSEDSLYIEDDTINILACALRDGFFDGIMVHAANCNDFDVTNLETTGDEIIKYCRETANK